MAVCVPTLEAWDQFVWLLSVAVPWAATEVEQYSYCHGNAIHLGPVMPVAQFKVTDEEGTYLCAAWALVFEGSVLAYNPARDEVEWVPARGIANDLSWAKERMAVVLANYVPCIPQEADRIMELRACCLMGWSDNSSSEEEDNEPMEEEDGKPEGDEHEETEGQEEADPESSPGSDGIKQGKTREEAEPQG